VYGDCGTESGDGVDEMVGEGPYIEVATGCGSVEVVGADCLGDVARHNQSLFSTGKVVHRASR
jgi:hypothetical protein